MDGMTLNPRISYPTGIRSKPAYQHKKRSMEEQL
jgi:hypothetical protein